MQNYQTNPLSHPHRIRLPTLRPLPSRHFLCPSTALLRVRRAFVVNPPLRNEPIGPTTAVREVVGHFGPGVPLVPARRDGTRSDPLQSRPPLGGFTMRNYETKPNLGKAGRIGNALNRAYDERTGWESIPRTQLANCLTRNQGALCPVGAIPARRDLLPVPAPLQAARAGPGSPDPSHPAEGYGFRS